MGYDFGALKNSNEIFSVDTKPIIGERVIFDKMSNFGSPILKDYNYVIQSNQITRAAVKVTYLRTNMMMRI